jgi:hypothetical protein
MYESHFGLTGPPFRLPHPSFYYGSKGHSHALHLKYGLHQGEGFIVVTGDGAGRRRLCACCPGAGYDTVVALRSWSTQLQSGELRLDPHGFRFPPHVTRAHVIATLEAS